MKQCRLAAGGAHGERPLQNTRLDKGEIVPCLGSAFTAASFAMLARLVPVIPKVGVRSGATERDARVMSCVQFTKEC